MNPAKLLKEKKQAIVELAARYGASNVRVFGSVARGEFSAESDIDFLVDLEDGRSLFDLGGLLVDHRVCMADEKDLPTLKKSVQEWLD